MNPHFWTHSVSLYVFVYTFTGKDMQLVIWTVVWKVVLEELKLTDSHIHCESHNISEIVKSRKLDYFFLLRAFSYDPL